MAQRRFVRSVEKIGRFGWADVITTLPIRAMDFIMRVLMSLVDYIFTLYMRFQMKTAVPIIAIKGGGL